VTPERFEILARIGAGGMGDVYQARDTKLSRSPSCVRSDASERLMTN
jgi:serine/threonine protein kinase